MLLRRATDGDNSVAIGKEALSRVLISNNNTAIGVSALGTAITGVRNTALGFNAGDFPKKMIMFLLVTKQIKKILEVKM